MLQNKINLNKTVVLVVFAAMAQVSGMAPTAADDTIRDCSDFYEFAIGDITFQNNIWQRNGVAGEQCITTRGWKWDWPVTEPAEVRSYPAAYFGQRPWGQKSTTSKLPLKISEIENLVVDYEIRSSQTGVTNTSFDVWISKSRSSSDGSDRIAEIMIWLRHSPELVPGDEPARQVMIDGETFDVYFSMRDGITYANFVVPEYVPQGSIDIAKFVEILSEAHPLAPDHYLRSVELGNQITSGSGFTEIVTLTPHVNE
ncbi:MAG: hypothetical protein KKB37_12860 [Alphaproteobacteria bacterium]|nr:hypothetical protein [Alphaproteobacteria bacterium]